MQKVVTDPYARNLFLKTSSIFLITALFCAASLRADPWGKDAGLAGKREVEYCLPRKCTTFLVGPMSECLIRFHQQVISPADGPRSHHKPSSSQYTLEAMRRYGFACGLIMGCDRLMRENNDPWVYPVVTDAAGDTFKWDPVP
ncbi:MAG TPA: membrane protein insertion efficiency factor YidD [Waddliaceae bacterium]